jgi:glycosyltransferase involved in cell wall biosynthesis
MRVALERSNGTSHTPWLSVTQSGGEPGELVPPTAAAAGPPEWPTVTVVIPARNEARSLPHVLRQLPADYEVIVVDGNSEDGTPEVAARLRPDARVVTQVGRGKGDALRLGFALAKGDVIVMIDADGSTDPGEMPKFIEALGADVDLAKGSRFAAGGGSEDITFIRRLGNTVLASLVNWLFGTTYSDLCYGYAAFRRRCLPILMLDCNGFEFETLMNVRAARAGLRVVEVPSYERSRLHGVSNLYAPRDGWRVLRTIVSEWLRHDPDADRPRAVLKELASVGG